MPTNCGLSDAQAYRFGRNAEIFKPVCEFVPDLIRTVGRIGVLHNKTYIGGGFTVGQETRKRLAAEFYAPRSLAKFAFKQFEKRGLAQPDAPQSKTKSPSPTCKLTFSTAGVSVLGYVKVRFSILSISIRLPP